MCVTKFEEKKKKEEEKEEKKEEKMEEVEEAGSAQGIGDRKCAQKASRYSGLSKSLRCTANT